MQTEKTWGKFQAYVGALKRRVGLWRIQRITVGGTFHLFSGGEWFITTVAIFSCCVTNIPKALFLQSFKGIALADLELSM